MSHSALQSLYRNGVGSLLAATVLAATAAVAGERERSVLVLTSTNDPAGNSVVVFRLGEEDTASSLSYLDSLPTGGDGGASGNAGILQFGREGGAVANFGSNSVTELSREDHHVSVGHTIKLASG